jgi:uncharacterized OsmC-like protein
MNTDELRALQAPVKSRYKEHPETALVTLSASGALDPESITCRVATFAGTVPAGLHPSAGGDGSAACSGEMALEALVGCAGVTLSAVATALGIAVRGGRVLAEGDFDARGTLGISKETPVGLRDIRLRFELDTDASDEQLQNLLRLTERYCVVYQTLRQPPQMTATVERTA